MIVRDLLMECNIEKVAALHFEMQEEPRVDDYKLFLDQHYIFLRDIRKIELVPGDNLILASRIPLNDTSEYEVRMYHKSEMKEQFIRIEALEDEWTSFEQLDAATYAQVDEALRSYCHLNHYDMETAAWGELLGAELFEENINQIGRDRLAACLIKEMTFWGFSQDDSDRGRARIRSEIEDAINEMEYLESLPEEERRKHYLTHEELIHQLSVEFPELSDGLDEDNDERLERACMAVVMAYRECLRYIKRKI